MLWHHAFVVERANMQTNVFTIPNATEQGLGTTAIGRQSDINI
jgi:hypothetical protein